MIDLSAPAHESIFESMYYHQEKPANRLIINKTSPKSKSNQPIRPGTREHLVDTQHVEGVHAHAQVERVLARRLGHVLVARDARRLERLGRHVLLQDEFGLVDDDTTPSLKQPVMFRTPNVGRDWCVRSIPVQKANT